MVDDYHGERKMILNEKDSWAMLIHGKYLLKIIVTIKFSFNLMQRVARKNGT
jgi:hypothetical protein